MSRRFTKRGLLRTIPLVIVVFFALIFQTRQPADQSRSPADRAPGPSGLTVIKQAFREQRSGLFVEVPGTVVRVLPDDEEGDRHQRFVIDIGAGHALLVAHNIDLAPRVPLVEHDLVRIHGEYEWNGAGGVLHWTHHDPGGHRQGGWIEHKGRRYE